MKKEKSEPIYKYAFNKIFTGSYLIYNLGNELINFIETEDHKRLVYLNPYGNRSQKAADETKYVLHIMKTEYNNEQCYELVAVSKILEDSTGANEKTYYNPKSPKDEKVEYGESMIFEGHPIGEIFDDPKAHLCSFYAEKLLEPKKNIRILFKGKTRKNDVSKKLEDTHENGTNGIFTINVECDLSGCRNLCYSRENDLDILNELVESKEHLKIINNTIKRDNIKDEQCLAVICDRTNLEDSMSNQIAYFLSRNTKALENFIKLLNSKINQNTEKIKQSKDFKIIREHNKIDILLESAKDIIVIENKIDSSIIKYNKNELPRKIPSQLSKYYKYIMEDYEKLNAFKYKTVEEIKTELKFKTNLTKKKDLINEIMKKGVFKKKKKHFFILKPEYNPINENELKSKYINGDKYQIITYTELYEKLNSRECKAKCENNESKFLYDQFLQSLEYVKSNKSEQMRKTAYIRLKQRLKELDNKKSNKLN